MQHENKKLAFPQSYFGVMYLEGTKQSFIDAHHCPGIIEFAAVIRSTEDSDEVSFGEEFISLFYDLMSSTNQFQTMLFQESRDDVFPKYKRDATVVHVPSVYVCVRIGPKEIANQTCKMHIEASWR
jgi:hypothetical protein